MINADVSRVFKAALDKQLVISPPEQVFTTPNFKFFLTIGGDLVEDESEYERLRLILQDLGETEFHILENIGATITDRTLPFKATVSLNYSFNEYRKIIESFDPPFGWSTNHFFIFGSNTNWGIYIAEYPTINIIGCDKTLLDTFRNAFRITGNGYSELNEFLDKEFSGKPDLKEQFINEYNLEITIEETEES